MTVEDVRPCPWCRLTLPAGHACVGDGQAPCTPDVECGICDVCLTRQAFALAMEEDAARWVARAGTPGDMPEVDG